MSLVVERDSLAVFVFNVLILEAPLGLASVDKTAGWTWSFTESL